MSKVFSFFKLQRPKPFIGRFTVKMSILGVLQNHRPATGHQPPTNWQVLYRLANHRQPTHLQAFHRPPTHWQVLHQPPTADSPTGLPPTHRPPTNDHHFISRTSNDPLITYSLTQRPSNNWPPNLWFTKLTLTESPSDPFFQ